MSLEAANFILDKILPSEGNSTKNWKPRMNSADVEAAVEEFFERLKINPRTKQTQIAKVLEVSSLFYWVDLVDPLGHLSCFIGSKQLFHCVNSVV